MLVVERAAFLNTMNEAGWEITGLEPDEGARKKALELYGPAVRYTRKIIFSAGKKL